ncbi:substrate-binding domain-containing protein [Streptomyces bathyalis]|uniref:Substrate-binding domain-containing protein n=1 Tax=Streptomyces bathyalis TaxID=2710756 RepID=A0A7T1T3K3_9ACTN|nr:autoinducer 2 ABC transporter substrate-binding protein [Streptomyces bathyalis]QPP05685.1 substrate-binding domain-containing protein [Streptomyces bathyalis]
MRISRGVAAGVVVALSASMTLAGCSKKNNGSGESGGDKPKVAFVPKVQGIPYFEAMNKGGKKAAKDLGAQWIYKGPTTADPGAQTDIVKSLLQQRVDVLAVAPNDPDSMPPILRDAKDQGVHPMTSDTDAPNSDREVFVNQATPEGISTALTDTLMKEMDGKGKYAIVSCGQTAENLNSWIKEQKKYTKKKYPKAEIVDIVYAGEDEAKAVSMAKDLMNAHPDLKGLVGECTTSAPGVAKAVREAGKTGKVATTGVGTPKSMKPYLEDGSSAGSVLWDVEELGYLTVWAGKQLSEGKSFKKTNKVNDKLPAVKYFPDRKELLLGEPLRITKDNVDDYDY